VAAIDPSAAGQPFRGRIRRRQWEQLSRGLYIPRASPLTDVLRGWELVLPRCAAFTSLTAAELRGWWLPETVPHPIFAAVPIGERYPERKGLLVCRHPRPVPAVTAKGFRVTTGAETLLAAARDLGVLDLVILGDSALRCGDCILEELQVTAAQQRRGAPRLRSVLPLLDKRSESPWESACESCIKQPASMSSRRRRSSINGAALSRGLTCGWSVLDEFTSTTETSIVSVRLTAATWLENADWLRSTANEWASPRRSCFTKEHRSSPARTACWDDAGILAVLCGGRRSSITRCFGRTGERGPTAIGSEHSDHRKLWMSGNFPARGCVIRPHFWRVPLPWSDYRIAPGLRMPSGSRAFLIFCDSAITSGPS
jgi:hypothetical protein